MVKEQQYYLFIAKILSSSSKSAHRIRFVLSVIGLSIGITVGLFCMNFSLNLQGVESPSSQPLIDHPSVDTFPTPILERPSLLSLHTPNCGEFVSNLRPYSEHVMEDDELFQKATTMPRMKDYSHQYVPKIAFMFLTRGPIPLAPFWEIFFEGHEMFYSIYVYCHPSYNGIMPENSVFYGKRIPSKPVEWGKPTMIDAERRLLANALLDFSNERFILVSESCIPLFNFTIIYNYLLGVNESFISSYDDPRNFGRGRYRPEMSPMVTISDWRKGSQWFEVTRNLAIEIVSDKKYYPIFYQYCRPPCYMDEHYIPTLVNICYSDWNSNRSVTWVDWSKGGSHPQKFERRDISIKFVNRIRFGTRCTYGRNASMTSLCFLFARKFMPDTLPPLMKIAPVLLGLNS